MRRKVSDVTDSEQIVISYDYPHSLLRHIRKLQGEGKLSSVLHEDFFDKFSEQYADYPREIAELKVAYEIDLLYDFYEKTKVASWLKRAFLAKTVFLLVRSLPEREAVELVESLMNLFGWNFSMEIERKWETDEEDKANFHQADNVKMMEGGELERRAKNLTEKARKQTSERRHRQRNGSEISAAEGLKERRESKDASATRKSVKDSSENAVSGNQREDAVFGNQKESSVKQEEKKENRLQELFLETEETKPAEKREVKFLKLMNSSLRREIKPAERGNSASQRQLGDFYAEEGSEHLDYKEAARWYRYSANQGDYRSLLELGKLLDGRKLSGEADEVDMKAEGFRYFKTLAEKGYPTAQCIVGLKYYFGDYVDEDLSEAAKWLRMAAVQNNTDAQRALGNLYNRLGNTDEAKRWYQKAAAFGDVYSRDQMRRL